MNQFARPGLGVTELPPVNADDNGKVLGVSDGAWAKVAASGGSDLPDDPAQDGTYNLQNTVSSGTGTLSWASGSSGGGVLMVHNVDGTLDKTWQEIVNAMAGGGAALVQGPNENISGIQVISLAYYGGEGARPYIVKIGMMTYSTETANGYPMAD